MIGQKFWDISPLYELKPPKPKGKIICPYCLHNRFWFKRAVVFIRIKDEQYRVDIALKCDNCGHVPVFGVHISREQYHELINIFRNAGYTNGVLEYFYLKNHWLLSPEYVEIKERN